MTNSDSSPPTTKPTSTFSKASITGRSATISDSRNEEPLWPVDVDLDAPPAKHTPIEEWIRMHRDDARRIGLLPPA